jgi:hypothetical protein
MPLACKAMITVTAGVIPWQEMPEHTKRWSYDSADYERDKQTPQDQPTIFSKMLDGAHEYAKGLSNPAYLNWVRVDWIWV